MSELVFFSADDGVHGDELWVTDGTSAGTRMVRDIDPGEANSFPSSFAALSDSRVIFRADGELWVSDGTEAGTAPLMAASAGGPTIVSWITPMGDGRFVFSASSSSAGQELWVTDGTTAGTTMLRDIRTGTNPESDAPLSGTPSNFIALPNGSVVFSADDGVHGREPWITDGTTAGTKLLSDIQNGPTGSLDSLYSWMELLPNGKVLLAVDDGVSGLEPWVTDGTASGTQQLRDINPGDGDGFYDFVGAMPDGRYLFSPTEESGEYMRSWLTDGTPEGTIEIRDQPGFTDVRPKVPTIDPYEGDQVGLLVDIRNPSELVNTPLSSGRLGDGRVLFAAHATRIISRDDDGIIVQDAGIQLAITDGTVDGTSFFRPVEFDADGYGLDFNPSYFFALGDGRVAFQAYSEIDENYGLWVADAAGTVVEIAENVRGALALVPLPGNTWLFTTDGRRGAEELLTHELWVTDGSADGTRKLEEGLNSKFDLVENLLVLADGRTLLELERLGETYNDVTKELWLLEPDGRSIQFLTDEFALDDMRKPVQMTDGNVIFRRTTGETGSEPWVLDLTTGDARLVLDIAPGTGRSFPDNFLPLTSPKPTVSDFAQISAEGETEEVALSILFPAGLSDETVFSVGDLPEGISLTPEGQSLSGTLEAEPGIYPVNVTARDTSGAEKVTTFDWTVINTGMLTISIAGDWQQDTAGPIVSTPGSVVTVGRKDGTAQLFRVEAKDATTPVAKIENGKVTFEGKLFSEQVTSTKPLMEGKFTIDMATVAVSDFVDENKNDDYRLVADLIDLQFSNITIDQNKISFRSDLAFDDGDGTGPSYNALSTSGAPLSVSFGADGLGFGAFGDVERWSPDPIKFDLAGGSSISISFSDLGVDYESSTESIYLNGKATVGWGGAIDNGFDFLDNDSEQSLTIDLAGTAQQGNFFQRGDKYLKISAGPTGWDWDVVGEIKYEDKYEGTVPSNGLLVKELVVGFDTVTDTYSGGFKANIPLFFGLDLSASLGFVSNPNLALDKIDVGVDGLNYPIGTTGIFVQGGSLGLENLAIADPAAGWTYKADLTGTFGPDTDVIKSPLHGTIGGTIKEVPVGSSTGYVLTGSLGIDSKIGYFVPDIINKFATPLIDYFGIDAAAVTAFELLNASSTTQLDFTKDRDQLDATISLLGGVVAGSAQLINAPHGTLKDVRNISASVNASVQMPEDFPLVGGMTRSGSALVTYSSDNVFSNDKVAFWSEITIPLGFTSRVYAFGAQFTLEGDYTFLGRKDIPKISSWALDESLDLVILSADWEVGATGVQIELIAPDGSVLTEADIAVRSDLAIVEDLNTATSRHVALEQPQAGIWDLRVADPTGLGMVNFEASTMLANPVAAIDGLTPSPENHTAEVLVSLDSGDAATVEIVIFAAQETGQTTGIELARVTVHAGDPPVAQTIDYDALGPGKWHIYTRTESDGMVPMIEMHPTPITITGAADLSTSAEQTIHTATGAPVMTITITNEGDRPSEPGKLDITVPDGMVGGDPIPDIDANPLESNESELNLPALAPGEGLTIKIALPKGSENIDDAIFIDVWTPGFDANPTDNDLAQVLQASQNIPPTGAVVIIGVAQEAQLLTADISGIIEPDTIDPDTLTYQWQRDGVDILGPGDDAVNYLLTAQDVGTQISVKVTYIDEGGTQEQLVSAIVVPLPANLLINGTSGPDSLSGSIGNDTIYGLGGDDSLESGDGDDDLYGGPGDDRLEGGKGFDNLDGGDGDDYAAYYSAAAGVDVDLSVGIALDDGDGGLDLLYGIEHIFGSFYDDKLIGDDNDNTFIGLAGNDTIDGGAGFDEVYYGNASSAVKVDLRNGTASGGSGDDILNNIEWVTGSDYDDFILGDDGVTLLSGLSGNDTILGGEATDFLVGGRGNDQIDGGAGADTAIYSGDQMAYTLTLSPTGTSVTDRRADGNDTDQLFDIEFLDFDTNLFGGPLNLGIFSGPTNLSATDLESIVELYIAYFNRAPDAEGLYFWGAVFNNGYTLAQLANGFIDQDETRAAYPESLSNADFATVVYGNVLGRIPDQTGFDFWVGALDSSGVSRDQFILSVLGGAKVDPPVDATQEFIDQQLLDRQYLADKTDIGAYFSVHKGMSDVDDAVAAMGFFDGTQTSINNAVNAIDGFYADALDPTNGEFLMPLVGVLDDPFAMV